MIANVASIGLLSFLKYAAIIWAKINDGAANLIGKRLKTSALKRLIREPIISLKQTKDKGKREEYIKLVEELFEL